MSLWPIAGGAVPVMDVEIQPNDGAQFVPAGDGDAGKYVLRLNRKISFLAVLLNSGAMLTLRFGVAAGAAEAAVAWGWPDGGGPPAQLFRYGMVLLHLLLFTLSLVVSILSALGLYGDPSATTSPAAAALFGWAERQQVTLLCAAFVLVILTYAAIAFFFASIPHPAAPASPASMSNTPR